METFYLRGDFITLGQLLKVAGLVESGGQAKVFLTEETVLVNGEPESRRGRKLFAGDRVEIEDVTPMVMAPDPYADLPRESPPPENVQEPDASSSA